MMSTSTMNPVAKTHQAFANAAGSNLVAGEVVGLSVSTDVTTPSIDLDLYPVEGPIVRINPNWAMALEIDEFSSLIAELITSQLP